MGLDVEQLATIAVDCGLKAHQRLGPGLLESAYEKSVVYLNRHCEERSDEAIHEAVGILDCRASLAMTSDADFMLGALADFFRSRSLREPGCSARG